ncbi:hypothetical protein D3C72_1741630 [compost metagenome]
MTGGEQPAGAEDGPEADEREVGQRQLLLEFTLAGHSACLLVGYWSRQFVESSWWCCVWSSSLSFKACCFHVGASLAGDGIGAVSAVTWRLHRW